MSKLFDHKKTLQAIGVIAKAHGNRIGAMRLLKILYITDRELLAQTARTLTNDRPVAMENGPVLSRTYDFIKQEATDSIFWQEYVRKDGYMVELLLDPGIGKLSKLELLKLREVCERYHGMDDWDLSKLTHHFAEWSDVYPADGTKTSVNINWATALRSMGREELIPEFDAETAVKQSLDSLYGR